ncbi:Predicted phosphoribosyltransferase [Nitrosospira multiformis]|uniref:Predicted phosphoribosyltransferase n=1 Tax=Nitrosospira multiformis TaxID=1231 RepID=A0A1H8BX83_9PROT|nr:phosphoribosyltransferase [Nitrosospira multiformis]SEM87396.1 Predicted phosphoribosyltransferase [Nitrosospira multiformis]
MPGTVYHFADRAEAGRMLGEALSIYAGRTDVLVLALPRGGVPVAYEIARALAVPLDIWLVRKLGVPGQEELAMGAMAGTDTLVLNKEIIKLLNIDEGSIDAVIARERTELERRNKLYRRGMPAPDIQGKTIILVDDGLATGATVRAAIVSLREAGAARIVVAVPVGTTSACRKIRQEADDLVCLYTPEPFFGVGQWYDNFMQTPDEEVLALLEQETTSRRTTETPKRVT